MRLPDRTGPSEEMIAATKVGNIFFGWVALIVVLVMVVTWMRGDGGQPNLLRCSGDLAFAETFYDIERVPEWDHWCKS